MLVEFTVENFKSFKERTTFSMEATVDKKHHSNLADTGKMKLLKTSVIYGANASGKTKMMEAMHMMRAFVLQSHTHIENALLTHMPFVFDEEMRKSPTSFAIKFIKNEMLYEYSFSYTQNEIVNESLRYYPNKRPAVIFERNKDKYKFVKDRGKQNANSERVRNNSLYLSVAAQFNYSAAKIPFEWFMNDLMVIIGSNAPDFLNILIERMQKDQIFKKRVLKAFKIADFGITSIVDRGKTDRTPSNTFSPSLVYFEVQDIRLNHSLKDKDGKTVRVDIPILEESSGTVRFLSTIGPIIDSLSTGKTIVIDEIDLSFHSDLCKWIIGLFHDPSENSKNAQLIFNTHDVEMLDLNIMRRDQIWFITKTESGISSLRALSEYRERNDKDIRRAYLAGRYDGVPFISTERLMNE